MSKKQTSPVEDSQTETSQVEDSQVATPVAPETKNQKIKIRLTDAMYWNGDFYPTGSELDVTQNDLKGFCSSWYSIVQ